MKMKEFGPPKEHAYLVPPLDSPMIPMGTPILITLDTDEDKPYYHHRFLCYVTTIGCPQRLQSSAG